MRKAKLEEVLYHILLGLLIYMPFHIFLSRWLSLYTGGLGVWDAGKDIVTLAGLFLAVFLIWRHKLFEHKYLKILFWLSAAYFLLHVLFYIFDTKDQDFRSLVVATLYNGRIFAYLFIGMAVGLLYKPLNLSRLVKVMLIVSALTAVFAVAQYLLPSNIMTHFGYSIERGVKPSFFIDDKPDFPRVMSTLRDPNSYGAYLVLPITVLWLVLLKRKHTMLTVGLLGLHGLALLLTFSRGAWLGAVLAIGLSSALYFRNGLVNLLKKHLWIIGVALVIVLVGVLALRNTYVFKNVILHSDESTVLADPNELRVQLQRDALYEIADDPEGHGPGRAGLVAIGHPKGGVLTENYYLQIGYEVGVIGLLLFLVLLAVTVRKVSEQKSGSILGLSIFTSFWAYAFVALLIHLWSNEAVAAQWWLLAGVVIAKNKTS